MNFLQLAGYYYEFDKFCAIRSRHTQQRLNEGDDLIGSEVLGEAEVGSECELVRERLISIVSALHRSSGFPNWSAVMAEICVEPLIDHSLNGSDLE